MLSKTNKNNRRHKISSKSGGSLCRISCEKKTKKHVKKYLEKKNYSYLLRI